MLFGGSFDPPHTAHVALLQEAIQKFSPKKTFIIPSHFSPGKTCQASYEKRLEWSRKVFKNLKAEVSDYEASAQQTVFAEELVAHFANEYPNCQIQWLLGDDQFERLAYWRNIDRYAGNVEWLVMSREQVTGGPGLRSRRLNQSTCAFRPASLSEFSVVSSTKIREDLAAHRKTESVQWIPAEIQKEVFECYQNQQQRSKATE